MSVLTDTYVSPLSGGDFYHASDTKKPLNNQRFVCFKSGGGIGIWMLHLSTKSAVITMGYLFFSKVNLTVCLVHINSDKTVNRQGNPIIYLMFAVLWVN